MPKKYNKQMSFGYDSNGKRIRKWFHADTMADLNSQIVEYTIELRKTSNPSDVTFKDYSARWFKTYKGHLATQTKDTAQTYLNKCAALDPYPVKKITKSMCQEIVNESWEHPHAAKSVSNVLKQIFRTAVADGIIATNPADNLSRPKIPPAKYYLLTDEDLDAAKRADLNDQDRFFVTVLQVFGLRPGEALALQPKDFDFKNGVLHITKALELPSNKGSAVKSTKTEATRDIPIPEALTPYFRRTVAGTQGFLLFPKKDGRYYTKSAYKRLSERISKAINDIYIQDKLKSLKKKDKAAETIIRATNYIPEFTPYCFRHRRATDLYYLCQKATISTKQAAALMGHSEEIFIRTYSHIDPKHENLSQIYDDLAVTNL